MASAPRLNIAARTDIFPGWKQLMQRDGQGRLESETLSGQRMGKFQPARVQRQTSTRIQRGAITPITDDVTAEAGQMNSDLVLATGFQTHFDE